MYTSISRRPFYPVACSVVLLAAMLASGCDRSGDVQDEADLTSDKITQKNVMANERQQAERSTEAHEKPEQYSQQVQAPDRDLSIVEDGEAERMAQFAMIEMAVAEIKPTKGYNVNGEVTFAPHSDGKQMEITVVLNGLKPGKHGLHLHENGDCSADDASSAGGHFNPYQSQHGAPQAAEHHLGDLGNVQANDDGRVETNLTVTELAFSGPASVLQTAVVVHAKADDLHTDPAGKSGDRVGCGVVRQQQEILADSLEEQTSTEEE